MQPKLSEYQGLMQAALAEDLGNGDLTGQLLIPKDTHADLVMKAREDMVMSGGFVAANVFYMLAEILETELSVATLVLEGDKAKAGDELLRVSGDARTILSAERVALNFLQHMSAVATITSKYVEAITETDAVILDTRKTLPAYRALDKYSVRAGGGRNHRMRLDDGVLIKDNHIALCGGVAEAASRVRTNAPAMIKVEMECDNLEQVKQAVQAKVDVIMLDNMNISQLEEAVAYVRGSNSGIKLEASGNVSLATVKAIAQTGVDYISVGRITHSAPNIDIGLDVSIG